MRTRPPERSIADFDSASAMLQNTAHALRGQPFPHLGHGRIAAALVRASRLLPRGVRQGVYAALGGREGVPPERLAEVDLDAVASWATSQYPARTYPGVFIGAANGALTHVYAATGAPWLPQTFLVPVRWAGNDPEQPDRACAWGARVAPVVIVHDTSTWPVTRVAERHVFQAGAQGACSRGVFARYGPALARLPSSAPPWSRLDVNASVIRLRAALAET